MGIRNAGNPIDLKIAKSWGISCSCCSPEKCLEDQYLNETDFYYDTDRPFIGKQKQVGLPFNDLEGKRYKYRGDAPFLGIDTQKILKEKLGYSEKDVEKLFENDISTLSPTVKDT